MRVVFDALGLQESGGAKFSALGWMQNVALQGKADQFLTIVSRPEPELEGLDNLEQIVAPVSGRFAVRVWAQTQLSRIVKVSGADLLHFTKNHGVLRPSQPCVITVNDLNRLYYPSMFSRVDVVYWKTIQRLVFRSVDRIIAISHSTKRDLLKFYRVPAEKIDVIYPAVSSRFQRRNLDQAKLSHVLETYGVRPPYILSVGGMASHKNVYTTMRAFYALREAGGLSGHTFVMVGERLHTHNDPRLFELAEQHANEGVDFLGLVKGEDLPYLYAGASLFVYPSLYEGFGLAPLEAMSAGVPVLSSQAGSLPEVLGDAAWQVEHPRDVDECAEAMLQILTQPSVWQELQERGFTNAARFSWSQTAQRTLALYEELIQE